MSENDINQMPIDKQELGKSNLWTAVILGLIAFVVAIMPFFYLGQQG